MHSNIRPILTLMLICAVSAFSIVNIEGLTRGYIEQQKQQMIVAGYKEVFPNLGTIQKLDGVQDSLINEVVASVSNGQINGYIYTVHPSGYSGEIVTMLGFDVQKQKITGIKILTQTETPGLGAKCKETEFTQKFAGKNAKQPLHIVKQNSNNPNDIQALTAATITSRAVVKGVNAARAHFETIIEKQL